MLNNREKTKGQSVFGLVSLALSCLNIGLIIILLYRFGIWLAENDIYANPELLEGRRIPNNIELLMSILGVMIFIGFFSGIFGIIEKKKKPAAVIGVVINGILLFVYCLKYL